MKRKYKILILLTAVIAVVSLSTVPAFALTESEVQDQVNAVGKEAVTGNVFVWFLCAMCCRRKIRRSAMSFPQIRP